MRPPASGTSASPAARAGPVSEPVTRALDHSRAPVRVSRATTADVRSLSYAASAFCRTSSTCPATPRTRYSYRTPAVGDAPAADRQSSLPVRVSNRTGSVVPPAQYSAPVAGTQASPPLLSRVDVRTPLAASANTVVRHGRQPVGRGSQRESADGLRPAPGRAVPPSSGRDSRYAVRATARTAAPADSATSRARRRGRGGSGAGGSACASPAPGPPSRGPPVPGPVARGPPPVRGAVGSGAVGSGSGRRSATVGSSSGADLGRTSANRPARSSRAGRPPASLARQSARTARSGSGSPVRSGSAVSTWYAVRYGLSASNGPRPVAAYTSSEPRENTSEAGPAERASVSCSGDMKGGVPIMWPVSVRVWLPAAREMPKSMTRGPSSAISTLAGLRSRWTTPARWMSRRASSSPRASRRSAVPRSGPWARMWSASEGPGTYWVAIQGREASGSASTTGAVKAPLTLRTASISCRNRVRNTPSSAYWECTTLTATSRPDRARPR